MHFVGGLMNKEIRYFPLIKFSQPLFLGCGKIVVFRLIAIFSQKILYCDTFSQCWFIGKYAQSLNSDVGLRFHNHVFTVYIASEKFKIKCILFIKVFLLKSQS